MIDHVGISVSSYERSKRFYAAILASIGYQLIEETHGHAGFGRDRKPDFWITQIGDPPTPVHIAFGATNRSDVERFHAAAIAQGARDNGGPGLRSIYHPNYFGAFVLDLDGHNIEVVCHDPE